MLLLQVALGDIFQYAPIIGVGAVIPILITVIVLLIRRKSRGVKKFMLYTCLVYVIGFGMTKVFAGGPYQAAKYIELYVPWTSQTLENIGGTGGFPIDEEWQYTVVRLSQSQSRYFVQLLRRNPSWQEKTIVPSSILPSPISLPPTNHAFPNARATGFVYSSTVDIQRQYDYWTRKVIAYFDIKTRALYVYYDYGQSV